MNAVGVAHFDAATGGVTLATAVTDAPCEPISLAVTWFWWFSVTAVATPPITTTAAVANDVMASTRRLPPRHALIVKLLGQPSLIGLTSPASWPRVSTGTAGTKFLF